ncbi:MAG TPA: hypothetical protein VHL31_00905 [Geminicoccus sp.]|jgi:hypothetical protein|uniref:hypothetical protein n=1 Tax=Geminicoccus sp. TaxID=2024832 RepID=UPI002E37AC32|nr:hypothetical protein [Geminicoccus sp.]HEX2524848.1 hypothetical protein [Geminicoccus sp.]
MNDEDRKDFADFAKNLSNKLETTRKPLSRQAEREQVRIQQQAQLAPQWERIRNELQAAMVAPNFELGREGFTLGRTVVVNNNSYFACEGYVLMGKGIQSDTLVIGLVPDGTVQSHVERKHGSTVKPRTIVEGETDRFIPVIKDFIRSQTS